MWLAKRPSFLTFLTLVLFASFVWMRVRELNVRPMHNDEGVNAFFLIHLVRENNYRYDPNNYHGPSLYYMQLVPTWINTVVQNGFLGFQFNSIDGITDRSLRSGVIGASLLILAGVFLCIPRVGALGAFTAFVLLGFSPNFLYFSRYFIHEMFFVLFTLGIYIGAFRYRDQRKTSDYALMFLSLVMLFCTKETSLVTMAVLALSWICAELTHFLLNRKKSVPLPSSLQKDLGWFVGDLFTKYVWVLAAGLLIWFCLYTSFKPFSNLSGLADSVRTYVKWTREGIESGHNKPFLYWIETVLMRDEGPLFFLAFVGCVVAFIKRERSGLFLAFWAMGIVGAYSIIPYKTIWCVINLLLPMALISGYGIQTLFEKLVEHQRMRADRLRAWVALVVVGLATLQFPLAWNVTYRDYDKEFYEAPYVHTSRDVYRLVERVRELAKQSKLDQDVKVSIFASLYWPIPYYFRDYTKIGFWGKLHDEGTLDDTLIIADREQLENLNKRLLDSYRIEEYTLRPDFPLYLYINKKVFGEGTYRRPPSSVLPAVQLAQGLEGGLMRKLFMDRRSDEIPIRSSVDFRNLDFEYKTEKEKPIRSPFAYSWEGLLTVAEAGSYDFALESDDGSRLFIDGYLVVDNSNTHARRFKEGRVALGKGLHRFHLEYFDSGGEAFLKTTWRKPGSGVFEPISSALFSHEGQP